jgi:hypothetical protein
MHRKDDVKKGAFGGCILIFHIRLGTCRTFYVMAIEGRISTTKEIP